MTIAKTTSCFILNNCVVPRRSPRLTRLRSLAPQQVSLLTSLGSSPKEVSKETLVGDNLRSSPTALINLTRNVMTKITYVMGVLFLTSLLTASPSFAFDEDIPITTDNRIKTYIYNPNEVYLLVLHFGYQSHIEFAKGEEIQTLSLGDSYAWKITPLANRLFIKPLEKNMRTNMTIITNKRTYQFDIVSQELEMGEEKDLVYVIRFYYPKRNSMSK